MNIETLSFITSDRSEHNALFDTKSPQGLILLNQLASVAVLSTDPPQKFLDSLNLPQNQVASVVTRAVSAHDFPPLTELARQLIIAAVENDATFGLKPWELNVVTTYCQIGAAFDRMCETWREDMMHQPQNIAQSHPHLLHPYAVTREVPDDSGNNILTAMPYALAFPEAIKIIAGKLKALNKQLPDDTDSQSLKAYLKAYTKALTSIDLRRLPEYWRDVDRACMAITGRLIPIGGRESDYYDQAGIRHFPDMRLALITTGLDEKSEIIRQIMIEHLTNRYGH